MSQQLPPLNALRAFEAVARHLSFTKAATELNVTRAAISHQIRFLEEYLGFPLVERHNRVITLTPRAAAALPKLRQGFDSLAEGVHILRNNRSAQSIRVCAAPSFTAKWLIPRLPRFSRRYPDIDMQINSNVHLVDAAAQQGSALIEQALRQNQADVFISFSTPAQAAQMGGKVERLFAVSAVPVCSPALLADSHPHPLRGPADLAFHTLLHDDTDYVGHPSWATWLSLHKVEGVNPQRGLRFNHVALALDAAVEGQGVLLSIKPLAQYDIDAGRLCIPFDLPLPLEHAYYIVLSPHAVADNTGQAVAEFVAWLHEEAEIPVDGVL